MKIVSKFQPLFFMIALVSTLLSSCTSYQQYKFSLEEYEVPQKVFRSDFNQSWQAVLQVMKDYDLEVKNQEAGILKTRWIDNTLEVNFSDAFNKTEAVKSAKFKIIVNVIKGFRGTREVSKITIFKRQMIEQDYLQGWKVKPSDTIVEQALLYRIERVLVIDNKLKKIEEAKQKELEASF